MAPTRSTIIVITARLVPGVPVPPQDPQAAHAGVRRLADWTPILKKMAKTMIGAECPGLSKLALCITIIQFASTGTSTSNDVTRNPNTA
jgi:hypothetical protein